MNEGAIHRWKILLFSLFTLCPLVLTFTITSQPHVLTSIRHGSSHYNSHYNYNHDWNCNCKCNYRSLSHPLSSSSSSSVQLYMGMEMEMEKSSNERMSDKIIQAAADLTISNAALLGVKSLGVDYGLVRTGLGVTIGYEPTPLGIVSDFNNTQLSQHIIKLAESEQADQIIVGLPFHTNGTEAEQTIITREFANKLNCAVYAHFGPDKMPIYMWDERYTSKEAAARMKAANPGVDTYNQLDADAACIILEYYYLDDGIGAQKIELPEDHAIRDTVHQAWLMRKEEQEQKLRDLTEMRMNAQANKKAMMDRARALDEKLAREGGNKKGGKKKKKRKKKNKQIIIG